MNTIEIELKKAWRKACTLLKMIPQCSKRSLQKYVEENNLYTAAIAADFIYNDYIGYNQSHNVSSLR